MKPYYDEDGITIYHADCREVLPHIDPAMVALLLTDPPYGIGWAPPTSTGQLGLTGTHNRSVIEGDDVAFDWEAFARYSRRVVFGANYYNTPPGGLIVWDKTGGGKARSFMPGAEVAWTDLFTGCHIFHHLWAGAFRDYVDDEWRAHNRGLHPRRNPPGLCGG